MNPTEIKILELETGLRTALMEISNLRSEFRELRDSHDDLWSMLSIEEDYESFDVDDVGWGGS